MTALFGSYWAYAIVPALLGLAVALVVLALKPPRFVARAAIGFFVVCALIGVGMAVDAQKDAAKAAAWAKCVDAAAGDPSAEQKNCGRLSGFIGTESTGK